MTVELIRDGRSEHAITVDRALQAKRIVSYSEWEKNKNTTDLEDYDVRVTLKKKESTEKPTNEPSAPTTTTSKFDIPIETAKKRFKLLPLKQQVNDRLSTEQYVTTARQYEAWLKNPKQFDIPNIDDQPKGLVQHRLAHVHKHYNLKVIDSVDIKKESLKTQDVWKQSGKNTAGYWTDAIRGFDPVSRKIFVAEDISNKIFIKTKDNPEKTVTHETGHAVENILHKKLFGIGINEKYWEKRSQRAFDAEDYKDVSLLKPSVIYPLLAKKGVKASVIEGKKAKELAFSLSRRPFFYREQDQREFDKSLASFIAKKNVSDAFSGKKVGGVPTTWQKKIPYAKEFLKKELPKNYSHYVYRNNDREIFADMFAGFIENPKAVKKFKTAKWSLAMSKEKDFLRSLRKTSEEFILKQI